MSTNIPKFAAGDKIHRPSVLNVPLVAIDAAIDAEIAARTAAVSANTTAIATNTTNIAANTSAIAAEQAARAAAISAEQTARANADTALQALVASAFPPSTIPNLVLWLDANQITGQADNTALASWTNLAPGGAVVSQANASFRPTFRIINGVPLVSFPSSGMGLDVVWGAAQATAERTTFIVGYNPNAVTTRQIMYRLGPDDTSANAQLAYSVDLNNGGFTFQQYAPNPSGLAAPTTVAVMAIAQSASGAGRPEGPGRWLYLNGRRSFRSQDANASAPDTTTAAVTGITGGFIGGLSTGGGSFRYTGYVQAVVEYNRRLTDAEIARVTQYLATVYGAPTPLASPTRNLIFDGDSLTVGYQGQTAAAGYTDAVIAALPATIRAYNLGILGQTTAQMLSDAVTQVDPLYDASVPKNDVVHWGGTNALNASVPPATVYSEIVAYCTARRAKGFKVAVLTTLPRGASSQFETDRQTLNASIRANWATFADALVDVGNDPTIGVAGAQNNATYYQAGAVHLTSAGDAIVANLVLTAVNSL